MIEAIVYTSKSGHTLTYAKALATELNLPYYTLKQAKRKLSKGSHILYMSWVKEDKIMGYDSSLRFHLDSVIVTGIMSYTEEDLYRIKEYNQLYTRLFYLPGGIKKKRLNLFQRLSLKSIESHLSFKLLDHGLKKEEALALDAILHDISYIDLNQLQPIIEMYKEEKEYIS